MGADLSQINILTRREIEARIAGPLINAFIEELGRDKAIAVVNRVIKSLAQESGDQLAKQMGGNSMADFARGLSAWAAGDAYEMEVLALYSLIGKSLDILTARRLSNTNLLCFEVVGKYR